MEFVRIGASIDAPNVTVFPAVRPADPGGFGTIGAHGCFLSHLGILEDAARRGHQRILVLEDDANFVSNLAERTADLAPALGSREWGVFYGGYEVSSDVRAGLVPDTAGLATLAAADEAGTTHFIAFQGQAIAALGPYLRRMLARPPGDPDGGPMHVDGAYCWFRRAHPEIATLMAVPEIGYQRASRTDVHDVAWHDRTPGVRELAAALRRWRNRHRIA